MRYLVLILFMVISYLYATPQFAREYKISCNTCHSAVPLLNETGRDFLRNGFKFDFNEAKTSFDNKNLPLAVMLSAKYNSISEKIKGGIKPFSRIKLSKNDILYLSIGKGKNIYYQRNINKQKEVLRIGFLNPYTQVSSINKISNNGINCNNDSCNNIFLNPQLNKLLFYHIKVLNIHIN